MPTIRLKPEEWWTIVETVRQHAGKKVPIWNAVVNYYSVCIPSITTALSVKLWYLYRRINGTRNETYASFRYLPAFWVDACNVIDNEINRIDKVRADKHTRDLKTLTRKTTANGNR
jgi:hypothetical protein